MHSGSVTVPTVLTKVTHRPETLYVPSEVNTLHVDGLARIPGLTAGNTVAALVFLLCLATTQLARQLH